MFEKRFKSHHDVKSIIGAKFKAAKRMVTPDETKALFDSVPKDETGILYVHTPYCDKICSFCNLNRKQLDNDLEEYTNFLISEFEKYGATNYMKHKKLEVVYFGGGTPTIFKAEQLKRILESINKNFTLKDNCEFTFETTLHNLSDEKLEVMEALGVNRLSIGVQTFSSRGRQILNRTYDKETVVNRIREVKSKFKGLVCVDIIYNYPDQTPEEVKEDAEIVHSLDIDSSSFYSLMIHEGSKMSKDIKEDVFHLDYKLEIDKELHNTFMNTLLDTGEYEILEITKINKIGRDKYKYITLSNKGTDILPVGLGAGGRLGNFEMFRMNYERQFFSYSSDEEQKIKDLSGLFQYPKVYFEDIKKYVSNTTFTKIYELMEDLKKRELMNINNDHIELKGDGLFWGNTIGREVISISLEEE
jgi:coproporphyrinogen III oxidase-like Fe-S oxidoreductase